MHAPYSRPLVRMPHRLFTFALVCILMLTTLLAQRPLIVSSASSESIFVAQTATSTNWYVDVAPIGSDANDCLSRATPCLTIAAAIGKAGSNDTILLKAGTYKENLTIDKSIVLIGDENATTIIDGDQKDSVVNTNVGTIVRIANIIMQNGRFTFTGGGIRNGGFLTLDHSVVRDSTGVSFGGGIFNTGTLVLNNSSVINNTVVIPDQGAQSAWGGGILNFYGQTLIINNSIISGNKALGSTTIADARGAGGGIYVENNGQVTITNSTITGNTTSSGGTGAGMYIEGGPSDNTISTISNSTISNNVIAADGIGGGIAAGGVLTLNNVTITGNVAPTNAGGILGGAITMANTIIAGNTSAIGPDCGSALTSQGYNIMGNTTGCTFTPITGDQVNIDPKLGPLQNNGGPTPTHALLPGSPAIDKGNPAASGSDANACSARDQRGVVRPRDGDGDGVAICDIGAYEVDSAGYPVFLDLAKTVAPTVAHPGNTLTYTLRVTATGDTATATLTDQLPPGLSGAVNMTGGATFDATTRQIRFHGPVAPGSPLTITYQATVDAGVKPGSVIANTAGVTGTGYLLTKVAAVAVADPSFNGKLLLIYSAGDNNLSTYMLKALNSAERAAGQNGLVILMVLDGPGVDDSYLYHLGADQDASCPNYTNPTCGGRYVEGQNMWRWSEDVANPYSLSEFIKGAVRAYPKAGLVALSLVGHGGGWSPEVLAGQPSGRGAMPGEDPLGGLLWDEHPGTSLSTPALGEALRWSMPALKEATGRDKIDLLFLDACFMGMAEVGYELRDSVNYLLASENWKWAVGDYDKLGAAMGAGDARAIGKAWLEIETATLRNERYPFTYSLLNLGTFDGLRAASDDLANALKALPPADHQRILDAAHSTDCFDSDTNGEIDPKDNYCDLGSFADQIKSQFGDNQTVADAARRVAEAAKAVVVDNDYQSGTPWTYPTKIWTWKQPSGVSVFLPLAQDNWKRRYYGSLQWSADGDWDSMLAAWYDNAAPPSDLTCPAGGCELPDGTPSVIYTVRLPVVVR